MREYIGPESTRRAEPIYQSPANQALRAKSYAGLPDYEPEKPGYKTKSQLGKEVDFELTNALWGAYYFSNRGILAAVGSDESSMREYRRFAGNHRIYASDKSTNFAEDRVVVENNTIRLASQMMPGTAYINDLRRQSGMRLPDELVDL